MRVMTPGELLRGQSGVGSLWIFHDLFLRFSVVKKRCREELAVYSSISKCGLPKTRSFCMMHQFSGCYLYHSSFWNFNFVVLYSCTMWMVKCPQRVS